MTEKLDSAAEHELKLEQERIDQSILTYADALESKRRWDIIDFVEKQSMASRSLIGKRLDWLTEYGFLFAIKNGSHATVEAWSYFTKDQVHTLVLECIAAKGGHADKEAITGYLQSKYEPTDNLDAALRLLTAAGKIAKDATGYSMERPALSGPPPGNQDIKADAGKPLAGCLLEFGQALEALASVATHGATRYGRGTWKRVERERYIDALMRHVLAMGADADTIDPESGLPHLAHVLWNAAAIIELTDWEI